MVLCLTFACHCLLSPMILGQPKNIWINRKYSLKSCLAYLQFSFHDTEEFDQVLFRELYGLLVLSFTRPRWSWVPFDSCWNHDLIFLPMRFVLFLGIILEFFVLCMADDRLGIGEVPVRRAFSTLVSGSHPYLERNIKVHFINKTIYKKPQEKYCLSAEQQSSKYRNTVMLKGRGHKAQTFQ